jgi:hypothetical protein
LHSSKNETIATSPTQMIAIALSEAEGLDKEIKKMKKILVINGYPDKKFLFGLGKKIQNECD